MGSGVCMGLRDSQTLLSCAVPEAMVPEIEQLLKPILVTLQGKCRSGSAIRAVMASMDILPALKILALDENWSAEFRLYALMRHANERL